MKKFLTLVLAIIMTFCCFAEAFAAASDEKVLLELKGLGIINDNQSTSETVSRGEFAQLITALLGMNELAQQMSPSNRYSDVALDADYAKAVALLSRLGAVNGVGEDKFAPQQEMNLAQAVKILVYCTGYEEIAILKGGWPDGYIAVGVSSGILEGVQTNTPLSRKDVYRMLYNTLDVEILTQLIGKEPLELEKSGETLRDILMNGISGEAIYKESGVVTANSFSYMNSPVADLRDNEVVIDSVIYDIGDTNAYDLFGQKVDFFAAETDNGYVLLAISPAKHQEIITIDADDVLGKTGQTLSYMNENEKRRSITLDSQTKVLYNGTREVYPQDEMYNIQNGSIKVFDHTSDGKAELVMIEEYENVVAKSFDGKQFLFRNDCFYRGSNSFYADTEDEEIKLIVTDAEGNLQESFDSERVLSIFTDTAGTRFRVVVSDKIISGVLEGISEDTLTINGEDYGWDGARDFSEMLGEEGSYFINFNNEVVFSKEIYNVLYGYILNMGKQSTFGKLQARMLQAGQVDFGVDINEEDVNDTSQIPYLIAQNESICVIDFADSVKFGGEVYKKGSLAEIKSRIVERPVSYEINDAGEITSMELLEDCGGDDIKRSQYNVYEMTFGGSEYIKGFAINQNTRVICVPDEPDSEDNCMLKVKIDIDNNSVGYLVKGFDYDDSVKKARVLVIKADMNAERVRSVGLTSSRASIINSVRMEFDEEYNEMRPVVEILTDGTLNTYKTLESLDAESLKKGDVIAYLTNNNGLLENVLHFESIKGLKDDMRSSSTTYNYTETFGSVKSMVRDEVDSLNNILITEMKIEADGTEYMFRVPQRNKPSIYIYDAEEKTVASAELTDIVPGMDKVYVLERSGDSYIRAVVIVR